MWTSSAQIGEMYWGLKMSDAARLRKSMLSCSDRLSVSNGGTPRNTVRSCLIAGSSCAGTGCCWWCRWGPGRWGQVRRWSFWLTAAAAPYHVTACIRRRSVGRRAVPRPRSPYVVWFDWPPSATQARCALLQQNSCLYQWRGHTKCIWHIRR